MKSVGQVISRLPEEFIERVYALYGTHQAEKVFRSLSAKRPVTLRVNTARFDVRSCIARLYDNRIKVDRVNWCQSALIIKDRQEKDLEALDIYQDGLVYLQSLSSQVPPLALNPQRGENVCDLTAAPGGKACQMAAMMQRIGYIFATEVNPIRYERLKYNVALQQAHIIETSLEDAKYVGRKKHEVFDRVLLDAPCSGEGLFISDKPGTYRYWSLKEVRKLAGEQRRLMRSAFEATKPGGCIVYSTCTLSPEENEAIVDYALKTYIGELTVEPIDITIPTAVPGITSWQGTTYSPDLTKSLRILPSELMEGFFVCRMRKRGLETARLN